MNITLTQEATMLTWTFGLWIGESLLCRKEPDNQSRAIAIVGTDSIRNETVMIAKYCKAFLPFFESTIDVNGYGLEVPVIYYFTGPVKLFIIL